MRISRTSYMRHKDSCTISSKHRSFLKTCKDYSEAMNLLLSTKGSSHPWLFSMTQLWTVPLSIHFSTIRGPSHSQYWNKTTGPGTHLWGTGHRQTNSAGDWRRTTRVWIVCHLIQEGRKIVAVLPRYRLISLSGRRHRLDRGSSHEGAMIGRATRLVISKGHWGSRGLRGNSQI